MWDVKTTDTDLISASEDLAIKVWDIETRRCTKTLLGHTEWVSCLYIKDDLLISGSFDNTFKGKLVASRCDILRLSTNGNLSIPASMVELAEQTCRRQG